MRNDLPLKLLMKSKRFTMKLFLVKAFNLKQGDRLKADSILPEGKSSFRFVLSCVNFQLW